MNARALLLLPLLVACNGNRSDLEGEGLIGDSLLNPFPTRFHIVDGTIGVPADFPIPEAGSELPVDRMAWRPGFSPAQVSVLRLDEIDPTVLPMDWRDLAPGEGPVLLVDLDEDRFLGVMAELDAHPDAIDPVLLVRPLEALEVGHDVAVVVTTDLAPRPARFDALLGRRPPEDLEDVAAHYRDLVDRLEALGVDPDDVALAWDFPVADGTAPLRSALAQMDPPNTWIFGRIRDKDEGDRVAPFTWRAAEGTFGVQDFLVDGMFLDVGDDGSVTQVGTDTSYLYVHIPESVKDAPADSVPVLMFGHGIFGQPVLYLDDMDDDDGVLALAEEAGFIVVASKWVGLTDTDRLEVLQVARDFNAMHSVPDHLVQSQVNARTLVAMVRDGTLFDDPVFQGASGQRLPDSDHLLYYGISLGGIEGAVLVGAGADVDAAVFHAGGSSWSTMLERSLHWIAFEFVVGETVPDPAERQLLYAASQLFWDPVDPMSYVDDLTRVPVMWQECMGDEQVPNLTTEALARSVGLPVLEPAVRVPWRFDSSAGPLPAGSSAVTQFDPEFGDPEDVNRPAPWSGAHANPRQWSGTRLQAIDFLTPGAEGTVVHHCGATPCSESNPGP
ncbi:MAG: hypothetical protein JRI25_17015 [Deltaproteobacteria bacterium]|nr:hypothetical protein [Deltaproteobacteria bacterium]